MSEVVLRYLERLPGTLHIVLLRWSPALGRGVGTLMVSGVQ